MVIKTKIKNLKFFLGSRPEREISADNLSLWELHEQSKHEDVTVVIKDGEEKAASLWKKVADGGYLPMPIEIDGFLVSAPILIRNDKTGAYAVARFLNHNGKATISFEHRVKSEFLFFDCSWKIID